jgi:hypothetical protein
VTDNPLQPEINKRFSLNWLIQGAAQHAGMTAHHLVRDELDALDPALVRLYDQYALVNLLQYWHFDGIVLVGWPRRFWRRAATDPGHPFYHHPVLARHGGALAAASRQRARQRRRDKGFWTLRYCFTLRTLYVVHSLRHREASHHPALIELAKKVATIIWGIAPERLVARLTHQVAFGNLTRAKTRGGAAIRACAVGYGGVVRQGDELVVEGRGTNWQLLTKELVKGTAELICLHGLNRLSDDDYAEVIAAADGIDFEPWMLQTGGELWRRLLAVVPPGRPLAQILMHLARLRPGPLETLLLAVLEAPEAARELLANLDTSADDAEPAPARPRRPPEPEPVPTGVLWKRRLRRATPYLLPAAACFVLGTITLSPWVQFGTVLLTLLGLQLLLAGRWVLLVPAFRCPGCWRMIQRPPGWDEVKRCPHCGRVVKG